MMTDTGDHDYRRFTSTASLLHSADATAILRHKFRQPMGERGTQWLETVSVLLWQAVVTVPAQAIVKGLDNQNYLRLDLAPEGYAGEKWCLGALAEWCLDNMVGILAFASPSDPIEAAQYIASLGSLHAMVTYDSIHGDPADLAADASRFSFDSPALTKGRPPEDVLPAYLAKSLHLHFMEKWNVDNPHVLFVSDAVSGARTLMIDIRASELGPNTSIPAVTKALTWHLGPARLLSLRPENWSTEGMIPLWDFYPAS